MILSFHPCLVADHQVILGDRPLDRRDFSLISDAEVIILPQTCSLDLYNACAGTSALLFPHYAARFKYPGKVGQSRLFSETGCVHPRTCIWGGVEEWEDAGSIEGFPHELPFLIKTNRGHEGEGVFLIEDQESLEASLEQLRLGEDIGSSGFISQELIPAEGNALRVVIMGREMISYWKRPGKPGRIISSLGRDARIDREWRRDLQEMGRAESEKIANMTGINLAALDFVFPLSEARPRPHILEINYYFGRRGLGGSERFYRLLYETVQQWLESKGIDPHPLRLV
jgi:ribosomal protein S6--L-glutamate ligase